METRTPGSFLELMLPRLPLLAGEEARTHLDEAWHHIEDRYSAPGLAVPRPKAFFIQVADDMGVGEVLPQQVHHQHERLVFGRLNLQPLAVVRDAKTIGNVLAERAFGWCFRIRQFSPPFDRYQLPSRCCTLPDDLRAKWPRNHIANPFKVRHDK